MLCMGIRSGERRERQGDRGFRDRPWAKVWERSSEEVRAEAVLSFSFYPGQQPGISSKGTQRASGWVVTHSFLKPWCPSGACQTGDLAQWPAGREAHFCSLLMKGEPKGEAGLWKPWGGPA